MTSPPATPAPSPAPAGQTPFQYTAQSTDGQTFRGTLEGKSAAEIQARLAALQLHVLSVEPAGPAEVRRHAPLGPEDFMVFNQQLAHLTEAGLPVERGLRLIATDMKSGRLASAAKAVADELEHGVPLPAAFDKHASRFPPLYGRLMEAGINTGNLPGMLFNLGRHLELISQLRKSVWRALAYPLMVFLAVALVLLFISIMILPKFHDIYSDFRTTLPTITQMLLAFGAIYPYILLTIGIITLLGILVTVVLRLAGKSGVMVDQFLIRLPVIGPVLRWTLVARWIDALRIGVDAGLDLPRAATLAADATASPRIQEETREMTALLTSGQPFHQFNGPLIPQTVPASIELAGAAGRGSGDKSALADTLATLSRMYQEQAEYRIRLVPVIITPIALILIALTVSFTIIALFMPLVKLVSSVSGGG